MGISNITDPNYGEVRVSADVVDALHDSLETLLPHLMKKHGVSAAEARRGINKAIISLGVYRAARESDIGEVAANEMVHEQLQYLVKGLKHWHGW